VAHRLLQSQETAVFVAVQEAGFSPREFRLVEAKLIHASGAFFNFSSDARSRFVITCEPGNEHAQERRLFGSWQNVMQHLHEWLGWLRREVEAPDLWGQLEQERELVASPPTVVENTPFTADEQAQIARQLGEIKAYVRQTHQLTEAQYEAIETRLDYLIDASSRTPRIDWRTMFIGAFLSLLLEAIVPVEPVRDILVMSFRALANLFGGDLPELPGGGAPPVTLT
jgi:hypothetical protein